MPQQLLQSLPLVLWFWLACRLAWRTLHFFTSILNGRALKLVQISVWQAESVCTWSVMICNNRHCSYRLLRLQQVTPGALTCPHPQRQILIKNFQWQASVGVMPCLTWRLRSSPVSSDKICMAQLCLQLHAELFEFHSRSNYCRGPAMGNF